MQRNIIERWNQLLISFIFLSPFSPTSSQFSIFLLAHFRHWAWSNGLKFQIPPQVSVFENICDLQTYKSCKIPHIYWSDYSYADWINRISMASKSNTRAIRKIDTGYRHLPSSQGCMFTLGIEAWSTKGQVLTSKWTHFIMETLNKPSIYTILCIYSVSVILQLSTIK